MKPIWVVIALLLAAPAIASDEEILFQGKTMALANFFYGIPGMTPYAVHLGREDGTVTTVFVLVTQDMKRLMNNASQRGREVRVHGRFVNVIYPDGTTRLLIQAVRIRQLK